jgi:hypothetical protein
MSNEVSNRGSLSHTKVTEITENLSFRLTLSDGERNTRAILIYPRGINIAVDNNWWQTYYVRTTANIRFVSASLSLRLRHGQNCALWASVPRDNCYRLSCLLLVKDRFVCSLNVRRVAMSVTHVLYCLLLT